MSFLALAASPVASQTAVQEGDPVLEGRVLRSGQPMTGITVGLHRVTPSSAGPVDSIATGPQGAFRFELPSPPGSGPSGESEVYFASVRHHGVLYFGRALNEPAQLDSLYRIEVHDTVSASPGGETFPVVARNLLLEEAESGWLVVDLFRLQNPGERTVVAPEGGVVWAHPLPPTARNFQPGESDLAPDAVTFEGGAIQVSSPVPPGERTFLMRYEVPELPVTVPLTSATERVEMLVREPAPPLSVDGMQRLEPVAIEPGSSYRRYAATEVSGAAIEISEGEEGGSDEVAWLAVILALVLAGATVWVVRRQPVGAEAADRPPTRGELLVRIAELDRTFENRDDLSKKERKRYLAERERLKARLRDTE